MSEPLTVTVLIPKHFTTSCSSNNQFSDPLAIVSSKLQSPLLHFVRSKELHALPV